MSSAAGPSSNRLYGKRRELLIARGQWHPNADAAPVRAHVRQLKQKLSRDQIAELAGVSKDTVTRLLYTDSRLVRSATAAALLRVSPGTLPLSRGALVSPAGACHRLQALTADGWTTGLLARKLKMQDSGVRRIRDGKRTAVFAHTDAAVTALYAELAGQSPPERTKTERILAAKARDPGRPPGLGALCHPGARPPGPRRRRAGLQMTAFLCLSILVSCRIQG